MNGKDIFLGLKYVGDDLVERAEYSQFPGMGEIAQKKENIRRRIHRPFLIAALIALMLIFVGCAITYMLSMQSIKVGDQEASYDVYNYDTMEYLGKETYVEQVFTIAGLQDTPANQAAQEWFSFKQSYDPDGEIQHAVWGSEKEFPAEYDSYYIYTQEMKDKIDEIASKYNLKLAGPRMDFKTAINTCDALGIKRIQKAESDLLLEIDDARCWENGNFYLAFDVFFPEQNDDELSSTWGTIQWNRKDSFSDDVIAYEDTGDWTEWEYITTSGHKVLITCSPSSARGYIICDRKDAVMSIMLETMWSYDGDDGVKCLYLRDRQMEQIADAIDHAIHPQIPTHEDVANQRLPVSVETQDGYTVKVKSTKTDGWLARIVLGITAPEGTVISRNPHEGYKDEQYFIGFTNSDFTTDGTRKNKTRKILGENGGWNIREDNDGQDNTVDLILDRFVEMEDGSAPFGWGTSWDIWFEDIVGSYWNDSRHKFTDEILAEGGWRFDIGFNEINGDYREIEFVEEPIMLPAITGIKSDGTDVVGEVNVTSFTLHTMSAVVQYDCSSSVDFSTHDMPMYAVMKDGSRIELQLTGGNPGITWYVTEDHVNVDEVDHVVLMDGAKLFVPET